MNEAGYAKIYNHLFCVLSVSSVHLAVKILRYSWPGAYFVAICVYDQFKYSELFGKILNHNMILNDWGKIINNCWNDLPNHYTVELDEYIIMPDHVHGIINIIDDPGLDLCDFGKARNGLRPFPPKKSFHQRKGKKHLP